MERPEIVQLFYSILVSPNDAEQLFPFLSPRVEWILSAADPQMSGEELPSNAIRFLGKEGFRQLAHYFRDRLNVTSEDLTGCITHHHLVFAFRRVRLRTPGMDQQKQKLQPKCHFMARQFLPSSGPNGMCAIGWPLSIFSLRSHTLRQCGKHCFLRRGPVGPKYQPHGRSRLFFLQGPITNALNFNAAQRSRNDSYT